MFNVQVSGKASGNENIMYVFLTDTLLKNSNIMIYSLYIALAEKSSLYMENSVGMKITFRNIKILEDLLLVGILIYILSVIFLNYNAAQWFDFDMYSDLMVAKEMARNCSLFPSDWVFGNQYYVVATPVLCALIYSLCGKLTFSMATASSLYMLAVLAAFIWCVKPFCSKVQVLAGTFSLSGAVILGLSAVSCSIGFQDLYTMASYYACYLFGILLTLGIYFRLICGDKSTKLRIVAGVDLLYIFALGMQSLRETLLLVLPMLCVEFLRLLAEKRRKGKIHSGRTTGFILLLFLSNMVGVFAISRIHPLTNRLIQGVSFHFSPDEWLQNGKLLLQNLSEMLSLDYFSLSWKWKGIAILGILCVVAVILALLKLIGKWNSTAEEMKLLFLFCLISICALCVVSIFLMRTRSVYFFLWYLLVTVSICFLTEKINSPKGKTVLLLVILFCGGINYIYNFYPDLAKLQADSQTIQAAVTELDARGVTTIYTDVQTGPAVGAMSDGDITVGTLKYDFEQESDTLMKPVGYLQNQTLFNGDRTGEALFMMSTRHEYRVSSTEFLTENAPAEYQEELYQNLHFEFSISGEYEDLSFYSFSENLFCRMQID